jgi:cyanophycinase
MHGGGDLPESVVDRFLALAGGRNGHIVIVPSASHDPASSEIAELVEAWKAKPIAGVSVLHAATRDQALQPDFYEPLKQATGVWLTPGQQTRLVERYAGTRFGAALQEVVARGGVVGGSGAGAAALSKAMIAGGDSQAGLAQGFDLVPGAVIDQHFLTRNRQSRLMTLLESRRELVGLGVDEGAALVLRGRSLEVVGNSCAVLCIAASKSRPARVEKLLPGRRADLIALSRSAVARTQAEFPPAAPPAPEVPQGALIIVGGGGMPKGLFERFVELAGGKQAEIVYIPCVEEEVIPREPSLVEMFRRAGAKATWLHTKDRRKANQDEEFLAPLKTATGIWFGGGRQWNLVDSYQNTAAHKLMHDVLARGGVIGGSSAGASIQGDYMPRGDPLGNLNIIAEGYERGLGFLTGVAIDQHFTQRKRQPDMTLLMKAYPQLLGIGLDEGTAIVVQNHVAEVVGANQVAFYDAKQPPNDDDKDYVSLSAGQKYDLKARRTLEP